MDLGSIIVFLIIIGVVLYLVNNHIPMDANVKTILNVVVIVALIIWLLSISGIWNIHIPIRR